MTTKVAIFGAGSTGCYIGGTLKLAGCHVTLICRDRTKNEIEDSGGITLTDYEGQHEKVMPDALITELNEEKFDLVLITLKCHQLESISSDLQTLNQRGSKLMFMQNGLGSLDQLEEVLPLSQCLQGITPYNVLSKGNACFHRGTEGDLIFQSCDETIKLKTALQAIGKDCDLHEDLRPVIYGKLLLNLNNAINALADLPLKQELETHAFRKVLAATMREWLRVCKAEGVIPTQFTAVSPDKIPLILSLPNIIFKLVAKKMLMIDPEARSSMWEDIQAGRKTEVEFLNGAVVERGRKHGISTPVNEGIVKLIRAKERGHEIDPRGLLELV